MCRCVCVGVYVRVCKFVCVRINCYFGPNSSVSDMELRLLSLDQGFGIKVLWCFHQSEGLITKVRA
jgi:hypothetical protein